MNTKTNTIEICMGSSCYLRGNRDNAEIIQKYIEEGNLPVDLVFTGKLCTGQCKTGPNIIFNGEPHSNVLPSVLPDLLMHYFGQGGKS